MSVSFFRPDELGNIAAVLTAGDSKEKVAACCAVLEGFSRANLAAWKEQYGDGDNLQYITADEIRQAARRHLTVTPADFIRACRSVRMMHYNAITNDGLDCSTNSLRDALLDMATTLLCDAARRLEARQHA